MITNKEFLETLSCPFTWGMEKIVLTDFLECTKEDEVVEEEFFPLYGIMRKTVSVYRETLKKDMTAAKLILVELDSFYRDLVEKHGEDAEWKNTLRVSEYIVEATRSHHLFETGFTKLPEHMAKPLLTLEFQREERGILMGCEAVAWSLFGMSGSKNALALAREAIKENPTNAMWHFIIGKNLRRIRRKTGLPFSDEEKAAFRQSFSISQNPITGIFLAQMYRESGDRESCNKSYEYVYKMHSNSSYILLRLALGFIRSKKIPLAQNCLRRARAISGETSMYLHYTGILMQATGKDLEAMKYYKEAGKNGNFPAEMSYISCSMRLDKNYQPLSYFLSIEERYRNGDKPTYQLLLLHIGQAYLGIKDEKNAAKYFVRAIELDKSAEVLTNYKDYANRGPFNIGNVLRKLLEYIQAGENWDCAKELYEQLSKLKIKN